MWAAVVVVVVYLASPGSMEWREVWLDIEKCGQTVKMGPMIASVESMVVAKWKREHDGWVVASRACLMGLKA